MIYLIADTHKSLIPIPNDCDKLIHLGDYVSGEIKEANCLMRVLVKGNHDTEASYSDEFDIEVDALRIGEFYFSHEPMERLPRGAAYNIHGHLHYGGYEDYGYKQKPFHYCLEPNKLYSLEQIEKELHG